MRFSRGVSRRHVHGPELRPVADTSAQERVRDLVLRAYAEYEVRATDEVA